jgi:hypothetical protein
VNGIDLHLGDVDVVLVRLVRSRHKSLPKARYDESVRLTGLAVKRTLEFATLPGGG